MDRATLTPGVGPAIVAGFVAVLVGYTSSAAIVFEAARALGADAATLGAWMVALGLGMGVTTIGLSLATRAPVLTAWSTPGAALIATSTVAVTLPEALGAFVACGVVLAAIGFSGSVDRVMRHLPVSLAAAMLAGVLLRFCIDAFATLAVDFTMAFAMFATYLVGRRAFPRFAIPAVLVVGLAIAGVSGDIASGRIAFELARPVFTAPAFSWGAIVGLGVPLAVVTMASQNIPGIATLRANGYDVPASPLVGWTGFATVVLAPFGGFAFNLAAITAALCMGPDADPDPARRYRAAVAAGVFYLLLALMGGAVGALLSALPRTLVVVIAGLALLGTIGSALATAVSDERSREPALVTFLVTASGVALGGIGPAFWGLAAGLLARAVLARRE